MKRLMIAAASVLVAGCGQDSIVTAAKKQHAEFVDAQPTAAQVVGLYVLSDQTVLPGGVSALGGRQCDLDVRSDGTFSITNYPQSAGGNFTSFHSTTGNWRITSVGTSYGYGPTPKHCWGFEFTGRDVRVDSPAFTGPEQPYGLLTILGDPDSNLTIRFKKAGHPTTPRAALSPEPHAVEVR